MHVHALGVNPADGALYMAAHTGLFRVARGQTRAVRVGDRQQDTMGFTVVGPGRFLGSGHPDARDDLPPFLGLIASEDAGQRWRAVSLQGKMDFHALAAGGDRLYGYGTEFATGPAQLLLSVDGGRSWRRGRAPRAVWSLAVDPARARTVMAAGERGVFRSNDGGHTWTRSARQALLLAWPARNDLYGVDPAGEVRRSSDRGGTWQRMGELPGTPVPLTASPSGALFAALDDGTVLESRDGGKQWVVRVGG